MTGVQEGGRGEVAILRQENVNRETREERGRRIVGDEFLNSLERGFSVFRKEALFRCFLNGNGKLRKGKVLFAEIG